MAVTVAGILYFGANLILQISILSASQESGVDGNVRIHGTARNLESQRYRKQMGSKLFQIRQQSGWQTSTDGAFIHVGKTGLLLFIALELYL